MLKNKISKYSIQYLCKENNIEWFIFGISILALYILRYLSIDMYDYFQRNSIYLGNQNIFYCISLVNLAIYILARKYFYKVAIYTLLILTMLNQVNGFLSVLIVTISSFSIGQLLARILKLNLEGFIGNFLIGFLVLVNAFTILFHFYLASYIILMIIILPIIFVDFNLIYRKFNEKIKTIKHITLNYIFYTILISSIFMYYVLIANMPEIGHDALTSHLYVPTYIKSFGKWSFDIQKYVWALSNNQLDFGYSLLYYLGGEMAPRLFNIFFLGLLGLTAIKLLDLFSQDRRYQILLFLTVCTTPLMFLEITSLYVDVIISTFIIYGLLLIIRSIENKAFTKEDLYTVTIICFGYLGLKMTSLPYFLISMVLALYALVRYRNFQITIKNCASYFLCSLVLAIFFLEPYIFSYISTGNPVFPFFNGVFKSPFYAVENFDNPNYGKGLTLDFLYKIVFNPGKYLEAPAPGSAGTIWVFLPLFIIATYKNFKNNIFLLLIVGILSLLLVFMGTAYIRYAIPSLVLLEVFSVSALVLMAKNLKIIFYLLLVVIMNINLLSLNSASYYGVLNIKAILDKAERSKFLVNSAPVRAANEYINSINDRNLNVIYFSDPFGAGLSGSAAIYSNWYNQTLLNMIKNNDVDGVRKYIYKNHVGYFIIDDKYKFIDFLSPILKESLLLKSIGNIKVYGVDVNFPELLRSPSFEDIRDWSISPINVSRHGFMASVHQPITQRVEVLSGVTYKITETFICKSGVQIRYQINWYDKNDSLINADIALENCTDSSLKTGVASFKSPENSTYGILYLNSHDNNFIVYKSASIKIY